MTKKTRYFLVGSALVLALGLGGGLVAYVVYHRGAGVPAGLPAELVYVPADAALVAYSDVKAVMGSDMRRELERMTTGQRGGRRQLHQFAGIDLEKDVNRVVAYMAPDAASSDNEPPRPPQILMLAQGKFDQAAVERFIKEHGGVIEDYHGKHIMIRRADQNDQSAAPQPPRPDLQRPALAPIELALGFVQPDLLAAGPSDLVRRALDSSGSTANITSNADLMALIREDPSANAWVVGRFEAVSRKMGLPSAVRTQVPPLQLVSAAAHIDGGVKATIKAETADDASAQQLRDVVRGAISFARLQSGTKPELQNALKTVELSGTGKRVQLSFVMTPDMLRALTPPPPPPPPPPAPPLPQQ